MTDQVQTLGFLADNFCFGGFEISKVGVFVDHGVQCVAVAVGVNLVV